ncbi:YlbF family regulator [Alicyclobacillus sp. SO9]|uniref:YlbF family regulator n=1 Tax=Alicyclobacillus sp. SO9 TaxID=2665646 RepID=UPI0018E70B35|nr:YlbF family regulator [Alicyclobacillus sp. SO9]QQE80678.1 YlbF family regulator [Alicyclobacillus sp. SO9]
MATGGLTISHNDLLVQAEELADRIMEMPEVDAYKKAEADLQRCSDAQSMMLQLKDLQEQIAEFSSRNVPEQYYQHLSKESESLLEKLETIPEVNAFQEAQSKVNRLLQEVSDRLASAVMKQVVPSANVDNVE